MTEPRKPRLVFATRTAQQRPLKLGGKTFFSRRLTGEEELLQQEAALSPLTKTGMVAQAMATVELLVSLLSSRAATEGDRVDADFVMAHFGEPNAEPFITMLRTGHNGPGLDPAPGETFDLPLLEPVEIDGRLFEGRAQNFGEAILNAERLDASVGGLQAVPGGVNALLEESERLPELLAQVGNLSRVQADNLAALLNARVADGGEPVDGPWLLARLSNAEIAQVAGYLQRGEVPEDPKAGDGPTPENLPMPVSPGA